MEGFERGAAMSKALALTALALYGRPGKTGMVDNIGYPAPWAAE